MIYEGQRGSVTEVGILLSNHQREVQKGHRSLCEYLGVLR